LQYKNKIKSEETKVLEPVQYERWPFCRYNGGGVIFFYYFKL